MMESTQRDHEFYDEAYTDMDIDSGPRCRLCWQAEGELIRPCKCLGNQAYVHSNCLADQIETARIMKVANVDGIYNSRCPLCKFHIQFKIQEYKCSLKSHDIREALKSLDEDTAACLSLNLPIIVVLLAILIVIISGHIRSQINEQGDFNWKLFILEVTIFVVEYFLIRNVLQRFPGKIKKPVLITSEEHSTV